MAAPTHCPRCDVLNKKILDLEKVISTLRQIKNDEELLDTLFAASHLEATKLQPPVCSTPIDRGPWHKVRARRQGKQPGKPGKQALRLDNKFQPLCALSPLGKPMVSTDDVAHSRCATSCAEPVDETSWKPTEPAMTIAEEDPPRGGLTSTAASPQERPPRTPLQPSTPRKITRERPRRRGSPLHQASLEAVILGTSMVRHLAKHTENYCFPGACVSDIAAAAPSILRNYPTSEAVVVQCRSNYIAREQSEQLEVDFKT
ncbi:hypothetical protein AAFF_G00048820 [Aldrovandia affinis]|uniref:Uncharacterized protein n=1 Tax=Aldrovandia affinis TaxID=143900 RepID=A0AAD7VX71_9TELE|nr:hypothetical protein AAFF_G00048820 [Aldrovandia affinis]